MTSKGDKGKSKQGQSAVAPPSASSADSSSNSTASGKVPEKTSKTGGSGGGLSKQLLENMNKLLAEIIIFVDSEKTHRGASALHGAYSSEDDKIDKTLETLDTDFKALRNQQDVATTLDNFDECARIEADLTKLGNQIDSLIFSKKNLSKTFAGNMEEEIGKLGKKKDALTILHRDVVVMRIALSQALKETGKEAADRERDYYSQSNDSEQRLRDNRNKSQQCEINGKATLSRIEQSGADLILKKELNDREVKANNDDIKRLEAQLLILRQKETDLKTKQVSFSVEIANYEMARDGAEATWKLNAKLIQDEHDKITEELARLSDQFRSNKANDEYVSKSLARHKIRLEKIDIASKNIIVMKSTMRDLIESFKVVREKELLHLKISHTTDEILELFDKMKRHKYSKLFDEAKVIKENLEELTSRLRGFWVDLVPFYPNGRVELSPSGSISKEALLKLSSQELSELKLEANPAETEEAILTTLDKYCNDLDTNLTRLSVFLKDEYLIELDIIFPSTNHGITASDIPTLGDSDRIDVKPRDDVDDKIVSSSSRDDNFGVAEVAPDNVDETVSIEVRVEAPVEVVVSDIKQSSLSSKTGVITAFMKEEILRKGVQASKKYAAERMFEVLKTHLVWFDVVDGKEAMFWSHTTVELKKDAPKKWVKVDDLVDTQLGAILDNPKKDNRVHNSPPFYNHEDRDKTVTIWYYSDKCNTNPSVPATSAAKPASVLTGIDFKFAESGLANIYKQFLDSKM